MWDKMTYPPTNFKDCTVDVWEWIGGFIPYLCNGCNYLSMLGLQIIPVSESCPWWNHTMYLLKLLRSASLTLGQSYNLPSVQYRTLPEKYWKQFGHNINILSRTLLWNMSSPNDQTILFTQFRPVLANIGWLISLRAASAYMRQWIMSVLVQVMACCLFGAKPLSEPILVYWQLEP